MDYNLFPRYRPLTDAEIRLGNIITKWMRVTVAGLALVVSLIIFVAFAP